MFRTHFVMAAMLAAVATAPANAQERVPAALDNLKAHEIVDAFTSEARTVGLTSDQVRRLDSLHVAVRDERHQWCADVRKQGARDAEDAADDFSGAGVQ